MASNYHSHVTNPADSIYHAYYEKPAIRTELPDLAGLDVISIGCGSGVDTRWLADNGAKKVVGIDISSGLIDIARQENPDLEFHVADMEKLDFPDGSFDLAYSSLAIHYLDDWTPTLKEARRVLRDSGQYIFSCGHPIDTAVGIEEKDGFKYALLGRKINQATGERLVYGDYLKASTNGTLPVEGTLSTVEVTVYHQTFSKMMRYIREAGFTIENMVEPQPTSEMREVNPQIYEQLTRIPSFMIWTLRK
jgi:ubiquinone/menaquinone biosynthesis C-methylase UbiE